MIVDSCAYGRLTCVQERHASVSVRLGGAVKTEVYATARVTAHFLKRMHVGCEHCSQRAIQAGVQVSWLHRFQPACCVNSSQSVNKAPLPCVSVACFRRTQHCVTLSADPRTVGAQVPVATSEPFMHGWCHLLTRQCQLSTIEAVIHVDSAKGTGSCLAYCTVLLHTATSLHRRATHVYGCCRAAGCT